MFALLKSMIKEEWRTHSTMFKGLMFFLFPVLIFVFSFIGTFFIPIFRILFSVEQIAILSHYLFAMFGMSVGAFGLLGREVMNRRFGQASMIAYSSRTLPVSERQIMLNFFIKDVIYYFLIWILPTVGGFALASPFISASPTYSATALLTFTLSFLIGLSVSFLLSTIYVHSIKLLAGVLAVSAVIGAAVNNYLNVDLLMSLPPLSFFLEPSMNKIVASLAIIIVASALSIAFLKVDYPEKKKRFKNSLDILARKLSFSKYSFFMAKDLLDMHRSEGGVGKIIFSFLFPLAIVWLLLSVFLKILPMANPLIMFSIFLGIISSSIYNWLTEFDLFTAYSFLPIKVSTIIKGKLRTYGLLNAISLVILIILALGEKNPYYFIPALLSFIAVSSYVLAVNVYLTGLYPNIMLYNAKILLAYILSISPILVVMIFLSVFNPFYLLGSPLLAIAGVYLINRSFRKWDSWSQPNF